MGLDLVDHQAKLESQLNNAVTENEKIIALIELAYEFRLRDVERTTNLIEQAQILIQQSKDVYESESCHILIVQGWLNYLEDKLDTSLEIGQKAYIWFSGQPEPLGLMRCHYLFSAIHRRMGNYDQAIQCSLEHLKFAEQLNDKRNQAEAYNILGLISIEMHEFSNVKHYFDIANSLFDEIGNILEKQHIFVNLVYYYYSIEDYHEALNHAHRGLDFIKRHNLSNSFAATVNLEHIGDCYYMLGEYETALEYYNQGLELARSSHYKLQEIRFSMQLGQIHLKLQQYDTALEYLQQVINDTNLASSRYNHVLLQSHELLADVYEQQGHLGLALHHLKQGNKISKVLQMNKNKVSMQYYEIMNEIQQTKFKHEQLRLQNEKDRQYFQRLSQISNEVISTASHDLKNPLANILLSVELLQRYGNMPENKAKQILERIKNSALNMRRLIADLLDVAKLETQRALEKQSVSLDAFVHGIIDTSQPVAESKNIQLTVQNLTTIETALFDPHRMRQVLDNLISNSLKYTPDGGQIDVLIENTSDDLLFHVKDTGLGIPAKDIPHLYERFYRVDEQEHKSKEGTGLGLSIVKMIVEQHGGEIWVKSVLGQGSTFSLKIPFQQNAMLETGV